MGCICAGGRCWWPHAGVWCGHEPRRPEPQAAATTRVEALRPADPWAAPVRDGKLLPLLMQLVRVGKDVEGDCRRVPGMKRTADEVTVLLMSLAAAAAGYGSNWGRRH
ncbi:hypothetical protein SETIT_2G026800v2 [Setaria italica]|uniref:Uncharacterized protein n=1 Tax=Setaria italica TaxID=4555 RepID=A0A368PUV7_SETIT|nr:hypothetical protein SETIT_2G026800v2 [Setaria italica]